ncbi:MAG: GNAT family N-acetyltransferase [Chloroflexi bacterium]|nr:GNAT family N-acetyltransferase [Chloroflexota bacterium]
MNLEYRKLTLDDFDAVAALDEMVEGELPNPERAAYWRDNAFEFDRSMAAFDEGQLVGQSMTYSLGISVPGGSIVPCAGISWIGVLPTHRRRGIMRAMMRWQIDDIHERGEPLAALYASQAPIYGRFGYGMSHFQEKWEIDADNSAFEHEPDPAGQIRFVEYEEAAATFKPVHEQAMRLFPGMVTRSDAFWTARLYDDGSVPSQPPKLFYVAYDAGAEIEGFAAYSIDNKWDDSLPRQVLTVKELIALSDRAYAGLWRFCLDVDLVSTVRAVRPPDEPLVWLLADQRAMKRDVADSMYLRVVDVPDALSACEYGTEDSMVIEVVDEFCPWNDGRFLLDAGPDGSACSPTTESPDVTMAARELGSLYLGGVNARSLHRAGRIEDHSGDGVARLDRMFRSTVSPWAHMAW